MLEGDDLESDKVDFEMDVGPPREPVHITNDFCDACVLVYSTNSVPLRLGYYVCVRVL